jgi:hypothetical protein
MVTERNPTDALNQALSEQRVDGAEKDAFEVIAKLLDLPVEMVYRVIFAHENTPRQAVDRDVPWGELIPSSDVRAAIKKQMRVGANRVIIRRAIENGEHIPVPVKLLIGPDEKVKICSGCPMQFECIAGSLHTPDECYDNLRSSVSVVPLRINKGQVDVKANQPLGKYSVPIGSFFLHY